MSQPVSYYKYFKDGGGTVLFKFWSNSDGTRTFVWDTGTVDPDKITVMADPRFGVRTGVIPSPSDIQSVEDMFPPSGTADPLQVHVIGVDQIKDYSLTNTFADFSGMDWLLYYQSQQPWMNLGSGMESMNDANGNLFLDLKNKFISGDNGLVAITGNGADMMLTGEYDTISGQHRIKIFDSTTASFPVFNNSDGAGNEVTINNGADGSPFLNSTMGRLYYGTGAPFCIIGGGNARINFQGGDLACELADGAASIFYTNAFGNQVMLAQTGTFSGGIIGLGGTNGQNVVDTQFRNLTAQSGVVAANFMDENNFILTGALSFGGGSGAASTAQLLGNGAFTSAPAGTLASGAWEAEIYDNGVAPVFRVRYNNGSTVKVGDLALV